MRRQGRILPFIGTVFIAVATFLSTVWAHTGANHDASEIAANAAVMWLESVQSGSGEVSTQSDLANAYQSTAEALTAFTLLNVTTADSLSAGSSISQSPQALSTEGIARTLIALDQNNLSDPLLQAELLSRQNADGGFGEFQGYGSNALDTGYALLSLQKTGADTPIASQALGYLISTQGSNGSFTVYFNNSSSVVTSIVLQAVRPYALTFSITNLMTGAIEYLYSVQHDRYGWGSSYWETAIVLQALIPLTSDVTRYQNSLEYLIGGQSISGDWEGSVYTTALAAGALKLSSSVEIPLDPEKASVRGVIVDASTGAGIVGVQIDLQGTESEMIEVGQSGEFTISNIDADSHVISYSAEGYSGASQSVTLAKGQLIDVGTIELTIAPTTALVAGIVTDVDGKPIQGATVQATIGQVVVSDVTGQDGAYQFVVGAGVADIEVTANEFHSVSVSAELVAGNELRFSPTLQSAQEDLPESSSVFGFVVDDQGWAIEQVDISVTGGGSTQTLVDGRFEIADIESGDLTFTVSKEGYQSVQFTAAVPKRSSVNFGTLTLREEVNLLSTTIYGTVTDILSGEVLESAIVSVGEVSTTTDSSGNYTVENVSVLEISVDVSAAGYLSTSKQITLSQHGKVQLDIPVRQADLGSVTITDVNTNQSTYGSYDAVLITASIINNTAVSQGVRLFAVVTNQEGDEVANFSGYFIPPLDPQSGDEELAHYQQHFDDAIEEFSPGEQRAVTLEQWWSNRASEPGDYTVTIQAFDSQASSLVAEHSTTVTIEPQQSLSLDGKFSPSYVLLDNSADIDFMADIFNTSNINTSVSFDYQLSDPSGGILTTGTAQIDLAPEERNRSFVFETFSYYFSSSGNYQLSISNVNGAELVEIAEGAIFVPPSIRLRATQSLDSYVVVPLEGVAVQSKIQIEGVDGE